MISKTAKLKGLRIEASFPAIPFLVARIKRIRGGYFDKENKQPAVIIFEIIRN